MKEKFIILFFLFKYYYATYYSLRLNKIYLPVISTSDNNPNNTNNITDIHLNISKYNNGTKNEEIESDVYADLPLNLSDLNMLNESYLKTKNLKHESYSADFYLGPNKQYFRLLLSTSDDYITISSIDCDSCNVSNKYNSTLSNNNTQLHFSYEEINSDESIDYTFFQDSLFLPTELKANNVTKREIISIPKINFKVIESHISGFLNSDLIDGILALNLKNNLEIKNSSFIRELYYEGKISSPSFSIIITSSNINRLYLGNIMKNDYIKNYIDSSMNKGECEIISNKWKCQIEEIEYKDFIYEENGHHIRASSSIINFDLKINKLIIPDIYYRLIVVGYKLVTKSCGKRCSYTERENAKTCRKYGDTIYCSCLDINDFGIVTFHFENNSKLDIDLRNYVHYDNSYRCRVDIDLTERDEFTIGLRGLNNTILSFNMDEKKVEFFHKKPNINYFWYYFGVTALILLLITFDYIVSRS